nr:hypothetical protein [Enterobacter roggenkampii]
MSARIMTVGPGAVVQDRDHARAADAGGDRIAESAQLLRHAGRGLDFETRQLGVAVKVVEQGAEVGVVVGLDGSLQGGVLRHGGRGACGQNGSQNGGERGLLHNGVPSNVTYDLSC